MDSDALLKILADGQFHSGEALGERLSVSRAAVWKQIRRLRELGLEVHSVSGRGYRLPGGLDLLDAGRLRSDIAPVDAALASRLFLHSTIDSTNAEAMRQLRAGERRCVVLSEHQAQGRGRRGRKWVSPFGRNIYLSLLWPFEQGVAALEGLSLVCALAVEQALVDLGVEGVELKWPNDVLCRGRKLAGILLEVQGDFSDHCQLIIGIGVNTEIPGSAADHIDQPYSDIRGITGQAVDRNVLAAALLLRLLDSLALFEQQGFAVFRQAWLQRDRYRGQRVELRYGDRTLRGVLEGVDDNGRVQLLDEATGLLRTVAGGELFPSLRPAGT